MCETQLSQKIIINIRVFHKKDKICVMVSNLMESIHYFLITYLWIFNVRILNATTRAICLRKYLLRAS